MAWAIPTSKESARARSGSGSGSGFGSGNGKLGLVWISLPTDQDVRGRARPDSARLDRWWAQPETPQEIAVARQHTIDPALVFRNTPDGGSHPPMRPSPPASDQLNLV
ncbi:hypothetical protein FHL15_011334 [Xylaria flabelliformis]|uniref:Uncharacterized protein n=1 Tax=Xylaria flabelliformis TaxID=2512241 RepID=A0A553HIJ9_9PEZI|nr:hypothetical protein FHL15_011334 [Xylaria flabelliformis]